jgi:hypothetical protein
LVGVAVVLAAPEMAVRIMTVLVGAVADLIEFLTRILLHQGRYLDYQLALVVLVDLVADLPVNQQQSQEQE